MKLALVPITLAALVGSAFGDLDLRKNTVVKVTFDQSVSLRRNQEGDRFTATVAEGPDLPVGSKFLGQVVEIHPADGPHKAYMDLRFDGVRLPNGDTFNVRAVPVKMDYLKRDDDGRFRIDQPKVRKENYVLGGLLGGTLLGSLVHKSFEGAFVGVLAGIIVAESSAADSAEGIAVRRGAAMGALIQEDVRPGDAYRGADTRPVNDGDDPYGRAKPSKPQDDDPYALSRPTRESDPVRQNDPPRQSDDDPFGRRNNSVRDLYGDGHRREPRPLRDIAITIDDRRLSFPNDQAPYWSETSLMVPLKVVSSQVGLQVDQANEGHVLYLSNDDVSMRLEQGERTIRLNGRRQRLPRAIEIRDGVLYGPVDLFNQMRLGTVRINGTKLEKPA